MYFLAANEVRVARIMALSLHVRRRINLTAELCIRRKAMLIA